jgi:hypothetical protein
MVSGSSISRSLATPRTADFDAMTSTPEMVKGIAERIER